ncbi:MAG: HisA/HisF-related TIM barrel protein [Acidimicrobiia bacterium]|nr:HisA/HisF-related TIM barrel protein [Acidimicrobiia bacterium]
MDLYARVNILDGRSVRLPHGNVAAAIALDADPLGRVKAWVESGADRIHIVDLDAAAYGDYRNRALIDQIVSEVGVPVQVAGGIRSHIEAARLVEMGAWRIVMGTAAIEDQNMVWDLCRENPDRIVVSLDVRPDEEIATRGWTKNSGRYLEEVLIEMSAAGVSAFLVAEAGRDALEEAPDFKILTEALAVVDQPVVAAGGVRNLDDLRRLLSLEASGHRLAGVIVGREVTQGRFTIEQAKAVIAEGPPPAAESDQPAAVAPVRPVVLGIEAQYLEIAEHLERGAAHARTAVEHLKDEDVAGGLAQGFSVYGHVSAARKLLDDLAENHSDIAGRRQ